MRFNVLGLAVVSGFLVPVAIVVGLFVGGFVVWLSTNILSIVLHSVDFPNLDYWESFWVFGVLWVLARFLQGGNT